MVDNQAIIIWGTQLSIRHHSSLRLYANTPIIIIESKSISRKYKFHKQKLAFVLTAMREYADELRESGRTVLYVRLEDSEDWYESLRGLCARHGFTELIAMRQNDRPPQIKFEQWCKDQLINLHITPNTLFLTPTSEFNEWASTQKRLQMEQFYRWQRKRLSLLMVDSQPEGGKWNYDNENRKPLPKGYVVPTVPFPQPSPHAADVRALIETHFADHPGSLEIQWLPTTRAQATAWLEDFINNRFEYFGKYEDAMASGEVFLHHSALSALMNVGLLHAHDVIDAALKADVPLASKEGFIRQIIGWREFMFGLYHYMPLNWKESNFLDQNEQLPEWWWKLEGSPEPPLEDVLSRLKSYGYSHHIERLMVLGNYMLLSDYKPQHVYDWFMTMYVDAYEWVMVPNVIGMSQYADGGIDNAGFASKPYISGSNYLQKMGRWWPTTELAKQSAWTGLYWAFLARHGKVLRRNHRLAPLYARIPDQSSD